MKTIVWFKRDLRLHDHAPLMSARGDVLPLAIIEPSWLGAADASARHRRFYLESLADLDRTLRAKGSRLHLAFGEVTDVLSELHARWPFAEIHSHEETGNGLSFARDQAVAQWALAHRVHWHEHRQFGVVRGLKKRERWASAWEMTMALGVHHTPATLSHPTHTPPGLSWPELMRKVDELWPLDARDDAPERQRGGRQAGLAVLEDFLLHRAYRFRGGISSPLTAAQAGSRLSPYLTWGCLSMREVVQAISTRREQLNDIAPEHQARWRASLAAVLSRLHWHCHFIQKLESEPAIERRNVNAAFDGLRNEGALSPDEQQRLQAWASGHTGYPLIDACMRQLIHTGWLNFRMRAMLVSFATHHLWLHWREPGLHLARLFLDYEPGIHYPQLHMQAGVTGINTVRLYNPIKQQQDQDPTGAYVRRWLPELRDVPLSFLAEPWRMPTSMQARAGCVLGEDYPMPIVDAVQAAREAKVRLHSWRNQPDARAAAKVVFERHGSRAGGKNHRSNATRTAVHAPRAFREKVEPLSALQTELNGLTSAPSAQASFDW